MFSKSELVVSRVLYRKPVTIIYLGESLLTRSSSLPESHPWRTTTAFCLALLRMGFTKPLESPRMLVGSYPTFSPLPCDVAIALAVCFLLHFP